MEIGDLSRRAARDFGDARAVTYGDRTLSFREFDSATDRLSNALIRHGLVPGYRVAILEVRVVDDSGRPVPIGEAGEAGEVVARGQILMSGYWSRPEETARTLRDGWRLGAKSWRPSSRPANGRGSRHPGVGPAAGGRIQAAAGATPALLPKSSAGKILRRTVRDELIAQAANRPEDGS